MAVGAVGLSPRISRLAGAETKSRIRIALGEYSFNADYKAGRYDPLRLAGIARKRFGLRAIDYVSSFWADKAKSRDFLREMKQRAEDNGVTNHLILVDLQGPQLGDLDESRRRAAIQAHRPWLDVAVLLGCSGIRVNLSGFDMNGFGAPGNKEAVRNASVEGYGRLLELSAHAKLQVLVQNHTGYSCDPEWLVGVMRQVDNPLAGIEADPGHFQEIFFSEGPPRREVRGESFDLYESWAKLMPYSRALNAKTHAFDAAGNETTMDYRRLLDIAGKAEYSGYIGIEWEPEGGGLKMSDAQGIEATRNLLRRCGAAE
jgi:hypothetical protein